MPQTIDHVYFDEEFISASGIRPALLEAADRNNKQYYFEENSNGTESVFYFMDSGVAYYLGDRENQNLSQGLVGSGPEGLPMESPAGTQSVTPAEFAMDIGNLGKGVVTGAIGIVGDTISLGRGLYEIGRRGGDESALDAFLAGIKEKTIAPTTKDINEWIDKNIPLPERMKGESVPGLIGEVVAPVGAVTKVVKEVAKGVKGAKKIAKPLATTEAASTMDKEQKAK